MKTLELLTAFLIALVAVSFLLYRHRSRPSRIDAIPPGIYAMYPMGVQLVAIDETRTRWTIIEATRGSKCNHIGAWYIAGWRLSEDFIFTLDQARKKIDELKAYEESFPNPPSSNPSP